MNFGIGFYKKSGTHHVRNPLRTPVNYALRSQMSEMNVGFNPKIKTSHFQTLDVALYRAGSIKQNIKPVYTQKPTCISHKINDTGFT